MYDVGSSLPLPTSMSQRYSLHSPPNGGMMSSPGYFDSIENPSNQIISQTKTNTKKKQVVETRFRCNETKSKIQHLFFGKDTLTPPPFQRGVVLLTDFELDFWVSC